MARMTTSASTRTIDAFWSRALGCRPAALAPARVAAMPHAASLARYRGAFLFRRGAACLVSVPPARVATVAALLRDRAPDAVFAPAWLRRAFDDEVAQVIGPTWLGYADAGDFRPAD